MTLKKRFPVFETVLVTVVLIIHVYAALSDAYNLPNAWFIRDDAYYYFKVAQNLAEGRGSTFDGINPTNGYHPLWMLINIPIFALARFDLILPLRVLLIMIAVIHAASAVLIYRLTRRSLSTPVAMLAASIWAFNGDIHYNVYEFGLETPIAVFFVVLLLERLSVFEMGWRTGLTTNKQIAALAVIATLAMFSRLDLVFLGVIVGIWIIFRGHPARFLMPLDIGAIFFSIVAAFALRTGFPSYYLYADAVLVAVLLALIVKIPSLYFFGGYLHPRPASLGKVLVRTVIAITASSIILSGMLILLNLLELLQSFPRAALLLDWGISLVLISIVRLAAWWFGRRSTETSTQGPLAEFKANSRGWLSEGTAYYGVFGGALALYMLYNKLAFGTSTPVSGQIKRWWGSMLQSVYGSPAASWPDLLGFGIDSAFDVWAPVSYYVRGWSEHWRSFMPGADWVDERYLAAFGTTLVIAALILIISRRRALPRLTKLGLIPLIAGSGVHLLSYTATEYAGLKEWYWITQMLLLLLTGSLLLDLVLRPMIRDRDGYTMATVISVLAGIYMVAQLSETIEAKMPYGAFPPDRPYMEILPVIEGATPPGSIIGMTGGGNVGYFLQDRTIVNMDGLINSNDYFEALKAGTAAVYLKQRGMDIVFANPSLLELPPYNGQLNPYLRQYADFYGKTFLYLLEEPE